MWHNPCLDQQRQTKKTASEEGKPKRPLSGYMRFCAEKRASVKEANPGTNCYFVMIFRYEGNPDPL